MASTVAIVILNWNGRNYLEKFLPSVVASSYEDKEVILADNASTYDSILFTQTHFPTVRILKLDENYGFAKGYNKALEQVQSDYYVLLNSDVEVEPGWIEPVIELMDKNPLVGACQPKLLSYYDRSHFEYAGACGGWIDRLGYPFARGRIFDICEEDRGQYNEASLIFWASGAALFVRASLYHQLKGLDEYFFAHQEEIHFCWRLQLAGYSVYSCPRSVVYHVGGGTLPKGNERKVFLNFRNNLIMLAKNLPLGKALGKVPARILLDIISAWKSLFAGQGIYFFAVMEAHFAFLKWLLVNRRQSVFPVSKKGAVNGWYRGSVVWMHFIRRKKTFAEIVRNKS